MGVLRAGWSVQEVGGKEFGREEDTDGPEELLREVIDCGARLLLESGLIDEKGAVPARLVRPGI